MTYFVLRRAPRLLSTGGGFLILSLLPSSESLVMFSPVFELSSSVQGVENNACNTHSIRPGPRLYALARHFCAIYLLFL